MIAIVNGVFFYKNVYDSIKYADAESYPVYKLFTFS